MQFTAVYSDYRYTWRLHVQPFTVDDVDFDHIAWSVLRNDRLLHKGEHTPVLTDLRRRTLFDNPDLRAMELAFWTTLPVESIAPYGWESRFSTAPPYYEVSEDEAAFRATHHANLRRALDNVYFDRPFAAADMIPVD